MRHVEEVTNPQLAVGMFAEATFTSTHVECRAGDVLALLTDGLVEVFDAENRELGFEWAKTALRVHAGRPLPEITHHNWPTHAIMALSSTTRASF